jgi:hypothetical protein
MYVYYMALVTHQCVIIKENESALDQAVLTSRIKTVFAFFVCAYLVIHAICLVQFELQFVTTICVFLVLNNLLD